VFHQKGKKGKVRGGGHMAGAVRGSTWVEKGAGTAVGLLSKKHMHGWRPFGTN
jgi:hypothetical protein